MADTKKVTELKRVQARAAYNFKKRLRADQEERAFRQALAEGKDFNIEVEPETKKSKKGGK